MWRVLSFILVGVILLTALVWGVLCVLATVLGASRKTQSWMARAWCVQCLWWFRVRLDVRGLENFNPALVVSNHQSLFDIPIVYAITRPSDLRMAAKAELFRLPGFGHAIRAFDFVEIHRGNSQSGRAATEKIRRLLKSGLQLWVAPEGTRSGDGQLLEFKKGSLAMAIDAKVPIYPIVIHNAIEVLSKRDFLPRFGVRVRVQFLPSVSTESLTIQDRGRVASELRAAMQQVLSS
jgi:1-acyl-sn-glycerol-3-phosphate acyltransferase